MIESRIFDDVSGLLVCSVPHVCSENLTKKKKDWDGDNPHRLQNKAN